MTPTTPAKKPPQPKPKETSTEDLQVQVSVKASFVLTLGLYSRTSKTKSPSMGSELSSIRGSWRLSPTPTGPYGQDPKLPPEHKRNDLQKTPTERTQWEQ
jgi:hypothetical protein